MAGLALGAATLLLATAAATALEAFVANARGNPPADRLGTIYGGFFLPKGFRFPQKNRDDGGVVMMSFGCGEDISFDIAFAAKFGARVHLFDPTPRARVHVESVLATLATGRVPPHAPSGKPDRYLAADGEEHEISAGFNAVRFFQTVARSGVKREQMSFQPVGLSTEDGERAFQAPKSGVSHFIGDGPAGGDAIMVPFKSLGTLMDEAGVKRVDALKIDIEGEEVNVVPKLLELFRQWFASRADWPSVLFFDMDSLLNGHPRRDVARGTATVDLLSKSGYSVFRIGPGGADYTFLLDGAH